jgi:hypothetical protein
MCGLISVPLYGYAFLCMPLSIYLHIRTYRGVKKKMRFKNLIKNAFAEWVVYLGRNI